MSLQSAAGREPASAGPEQSSIQRNLGKVSKTYRDSGIYGRFINDCRLAAWRQAIAAHALPRACVVDLGCAYGSWADNWKALGFERAIGIGPNPDVLDAARAALGEAYEGFASDAARLCPSSRLIAANGVVVHILEDDATIGFLRDASAALASGGWLVYSVIAAEHYYNAGRKEWFVPNACARPLVTQRAWAAAAGLESVAEIGTFIDPWALPELEFLAADEARRSDWATYAAFIDLAAAVRGHPAAPFSEVLLVTRRAG